MSAWPYDRIAAIYDEDMGQRRNLNDIGGLYRLLPDAPARILDIGCGTGRIGRTLQGAGYEVTEADRSLPMVRILRQKATSGSAAPNALVMDARNLGFAPGTFDAIVFGYCGFQYLVNDTDVLSFLDGASHSLHKHGCLVFDFFLHRPEAVTKTFTLDYERTMADGRHLRRWKHIMPIAPRVNRIERRYRIANERAFTTLSEQRWYLLPELEALLCRGGFEVTRILEDYGESGPGPARFVMLCARPTGACP